MELHQIGIDICHRGDFCIDRPYGSGDFLFLIFQTGAKILVDNQEVIVKPNACIIFEKNSKQLYFSTAKSYVDTYLHFDCNHDELTESKLIFNKPFYLKNPTEIIDIMKLISREQISFSENKEHNIDLLINYLLAKIQDNFTYEFFTLDKTRHAQKLIELRSEMYSNAGKYNSIAELANAANLSMSHFKFLYSQYFGLSCYDDLLSAKIMNAQHHLCNTNMSIKEISDLCGYENDTCFMRSFKNRTGMTPTEFRKTKKSE